MSSPASPSPIILSRKIQLRRWDWDVFICHAGADKAFGVRVFKRLVQFGLRTFLDERTYSSTGPYKDIYEIAAMEAARFSHIAVVLLSETFFLEASAQLELCWFLSPDAMAQGKVVPVFLSVSVQWCEAQMSAALSWGSVITC